VSAGPIAEIERLLAEAEDADDVLRGTVSALLAEPGVVWAGIGFVEEGAIALGPAAGTPDESRRIRVPIVFQDAVVGELLADGQVQSTLLREVADRIAPQVLIGWDTGGAAWEP
jgi:putative methionine-R-sulfoxide reductase with GAF domain